MMDPTDLLPLSAPMYSVLITLGDGSMHGYGVIQRFEERTGQRGALLPGSVYNTISRMLRQGMLEEVEPPPEEDDARRRYYRATAFGRAVARAETERLRGLLSLAEAGGLGG
jgi:DNA-binding PadR family transcriptional regulator